MQFLDPLRDYLKAGKCFLGVCVGMQVLFEGSDESPSVPGLGILPGRVTQFHHDDGKSVPHMGWNRAYTSDETLSRSLLNADAFYYFVHSFAAMYIPPLSHSSTQSSSIDLQQKCSPCSVSRDLQHVLAPAWMNSLTQHGSETFISSIRFGNIFATQFHPEKSGKEGLAVLKAFLFHSTTSSSQSPNNAAALCPPNLSLLTFHIENQLCKRIIACLDVRANELGDLVVTKGDQYDVRDTKENEYGVNGCVRNLGKPVALARRYYHDGADEITFLNITSFRECPLNDLPMVRVLLETSKSVFVPLTVGGGIRAHTDSQGKQWSALEVADLYFRSGADKVSLGSDAVQCVLDRIANGSRISLFGQRDANSIEQISRKYGRQAVVISIDPKRVYVDDPSDTPHHTIKTAIPGPNGEMFCWYQCTVHGGRTVKDLDVIEMATVCEDLGAGEILLNCIDRDGLKGGFDLELLESVKAVATIPVIASSGAGCVAHFSALFEQTRVDAALAAGIFHRQEVSIQDVKAHLMNLTPTHPRIVVRPS